MEESESGAIQLEIEEETRTSNGNENQNEWPDCRIYKVPYHLRTLKEEAYVPHVISIGPIHHNKEKFKTMEKHKERYFQSFMQRVENKINLENLVRGMEDRIRRCYVETVPLKPHNFVKMILLDACFILELFLRVNDESFKNDDPMFVEAWLLHMVYCELLLLENQLPFFVIEKLYRLALPSRCESISLVKLTFDFFEDLNIHKKAHYLDIQELKRLEDLLNFLEQQIVLEREIQHFTHLLRFFQLPPHNKLPERALEMTFPRYSATQLHEAGVKFKVASSKCVQGRVVLSKCVLDFKFEKGVLEIPLLEFVDSTESRVRNIMALEQCDFGSDQYITDFYLILDRLINTTKDVDLLCDKGIIVNCLGDSKAVTSMINNLNRGILRRNMNSDYNRFCKKLNAFYEEPWHRRIATLRRQYFSSPWRSASTIAAFILLVLTLTQTIFTILQVV